MPREMTPSRVQDMSDDMMTGQFPWGRTGPIDVAQGPCGARIIIDGHHRTQAAIEAALESVPKSGFNRYYWRDGQSLCRKFCKQEVFDNDYDTGRAFVRRRTTTLPSILRIAARIDYKMA